LTAADFQVLDQMRQFTSSFASGLANSPFAGAQFTGLADQGFDGFPIQRTSFSGGQATGKTEVKSIDRATFSDSDFSLGNARKVELIPGRGRP
jgi:hypothetical protein